MNQIRVHWDKNYGYSNRTGWSIAIDGSFVAELEKFLIIAVLKSIRNYFSYSKGNKYDH